MTTIKATCPTCGEVGLTPDDVDLRVDPSGILDAYYEFVCPQCVCAVRKPADERVVRLLRSGGVPVLSHDEVAQAPEPRATGPAFTHDDLLDFHTLLATDGWFAQVEDLVRSDV